MSLIRSFNFLIEKISLVCLLVIAGQSVSAEQIYIKIGEAKTKKSLAALPPLQYLGSPTSASAQTAVGAEIYNVINNDLDVSGYFQFISQNAFVEDTKKTSIKPQPTDPSGFKFQSWASIGADFLIRGAYVVSGGEVELEIYLYHVPKSGLIFGKKYKGPTSAARKIAHTFANDVLKNLTDKEGPFNSRLVLSSDRAGGQFREIFMMDWDGAQVEKLSNHSSIAISPNWSPDGKKIAYTAYVQRRSTKLRNADMFLYDVESGKRSQLSFRQGINSGANFMPDGKSVLLTISQGVAPDIYKIGYDGNLISKITSGPNASMNVEPAASPDGKKIAFSSDRSGRPMIYVMDADGSNVKRITFAGVFNSSPAWSPDGKKIAFGGQTEGNFDVFIMNADGTEMTRLTSAKKKNGRPADNEDPSFSPDGRFVVYTSNRTGKNQIYFSTIDGTEERRVTQDSHNYFKPKWSKNIE
jgi:TolB protein